MRVFLPISCAMCTKRGGRFGETCQLTTKPSRVIIRQEVRNLTNSILDIQNVRNRTFGNRTSEFRIVKGKTQ